MPLEVDATPHAGFSMYPDGNNHQIEYVISSFLSNFVPLAQSHFLKAFELCFSYPFLFIRSLDIYA